MENTPAGNTLPKRRNLRPDPLQKRVTPIEIYDAGSNMTTPPEMRDLAQRLLTYEANTGNTSEPAESTILRVYEKLRHSLGEFAGTTAFHSLASRALAMARSEIPNLKTAQVSADGALRGLGRGLGHGLSEFGPQFDPEEESANEQPAGDEGIAVIARLLGLLLIFLGEPITLRLLRIAWPGEIFDDRNLAHGRNA
jgi:hypothetical protein